MGEVADAPAGFQRMTALSSIDTWSSVHGDVRSTNGTSFAAVVVGVSAACGVSTSMASSLLAGVAVVDARLFFFGPILINRLVAIAMLWCRQPENILIQ